MRLLLDQNVYAATERFLAEHGFDLIKARDIGCSRASDTELLEEARSRNRLLLTRDRDFGALVSAGHLHCGVLYLRVRPDAIQALHHELLHVLRRYPREVLQDAFVVIETHGHRLRRPLLS